MKRGHAFTIEPMISEGMQCLTYWGLAFSKLWIFSRSLARSDVAGQLDRSDSGRKVVGSVRADHGRHGQRSRSVDGPTGQRKRALLQRAAAEHGINELWRTVPWFLQIMHAWVWQNANLYEIHAASSNHVFAECNAVPFQVREDDDSCLRPVATTKRCEASSGTFQIFLLLRAQQTTVLDPLQFQFHPRKCFALKLLANPQRNQSPENSFLFREASLVKLNIPKNLPFQTTIAYESVIIARESAS